MDRLDSIEAFVAVARAGGFSAAGRVLHSPVPTVSRKVAQLEQELGVRLLARTTRHVALTDNGRHYYDACSRLLDDLRDANERVAGEYRVPKGELSVTAPLGFGRQHLQPVVHEFLRAYPEVNVSLRLADRLVALVEEHVDCAVRISSLADSTLVARAVGQIRIVVCAAPSYLAARGIPGHPAELAGHDCVTWTAIGPFKAWQFQLHPGTALPEELVPIRVRLATSTAESAVQAAIEGLGLVQATSYQLAPAVMDGRLVPVLRQFEERATPVSLVYPSKRLVPLKLSAFLDFATPRLEERLRVAAATLQ